MSLVSLKKTLEEWRKALKEIQVYSSSSSYQVSNIEVLNDPDFNFSLVTELVNPDIEGKRNKLIGIFYSKTETAFVKIQQQR